MEKFIFVLCLMLHVGHGVIYRLNESMYYKMPTVFHLDDYASCLAEPAGIYCKVNLVLVSDTPSDLLNMIHEYSEHQTKHYNHTQLHHGICVSQTCKEHYGSKNDTEDLAVVLERCFNDTLLKKYELKATLTDPLICNSNNDEVKVEYWWYAVTAICFVIILINIISTACDFLYFERKEGEGNKYLIAFSIKRNWNKLSAPFDDSNPHMEYLRGFNGVRTFTTALVILGHSFLPYIITASSTFEVEAIYDKIGYHTFLNGTPIVQVFFLMSGFLLSHNMMLKSKNKKLSWHVIPKGMWLRWLRLTPCYYLALALTTTWLPLSGSGPLWHEAVVSEAEDCRRYGWQNLLYINNYFDKSTCFGHSWYLAADMQLYFLSLCLCVMLKSNASRKVVLGLLFVAGVIIPGVITYIMDFDAMIMISPEHALRYFASDPIFNNIYKRGHTNLAGYIIGLSMGFIAHSLMEAKFDKEKYKGYLWLYQLLFPLAFSITWIGSVFYRDAPQDPIYIRVLYAALMKPIFTILLGLLLMGLVLKFDNVYRRVLEWRFWTTTGRLSYCAYILHTIVLRTYIGTKHRTTTTLLLHIVHTCTSCIVLSFVLAVPFWLLVEAPMNGLVKLVFSPSPKTKERKKSEVKAITNH